MINVRNISLNDNRIIDLWLKNDIEGLKRMSFYSTSGNWIKLIDNINRFGWILYLEKIPIGFIDLEKDLNTGHIAFYISPNYRNKGLSHELLSILINKAKEHQVSKLNAGVEEDNIKSQKVLKLQGFFQFGKDKDGILIYQKLL